jgi:maltose O-acetyltransferase
MPSEKEKMVRGLAYRPADPELQADQAAAAAWMAAYNTPNALGAEERLAILRKGLGHVGEGVSVRPPLYIDYGYNISLADGVFLNFGCVVLDVAEVSVGAGAQIGPGVQILTADHPRDPDERRAGVEFGRPIRIGANVWIGAGALILPGVTIGDDAIVGAGAVVTRDVPAGAAVVGNPARPRPER